MPDTTTHTHNTHHDFSHTHHELRQLRPGVQLARDWGCSCGSVILVDDTAVTCVESDQILWRLGSPFPGVKIYP